MAADLNLPHVTFAGAKQGVELVNLLNAHRLMVVPSRWPEPFGIVALEGIACGCVVIGSTEGGLAEAIGPCGVTFSNGDAEALAGAVQNLLENPELEESFRDQAAAHLAHFEAKVIANRYLDLWPSSPMILLSHPTENDNVRQTALALREANLLEEFWTCLDWNPPGLLNAMLPGVVREQFERRRFPPPLRPIIHTQPLRELSGCSAAALASLFSHARSPLPAPLMP